MLQNPLLKYILITLCLFIGVGSLQAQKSIHYKERVLLVSAGINEGNNPAFLQELQDSLLFTAMGAYSFEKGDFVNYFEPNSSYQLQAATESYNRINSKLVVYGWASYTFNKGKNVRGSSFLYPYKTPFNFIEKDKKVRGDRRIERYKLIGAISYQLTKALNVGFEIDYQSINFAKLKDMRNLNDILDLKTDLGISYHLSKRHTVGLSYHYKRYIEGFQPMKEGKAQKDYYALVDKGAFMGLMYLYDKNSGILNIDSKKPWVSIAHSISFQQQYDFSPDLKTFIEANYEKEKGHFGNEGNVSIMYFKHNSKTYSGLLKFIKKGSKNSHILRLKGAYEQLQNNENLYKIGTTEGGVTRVNYYGENEIFERKKTALSLSYACLWGNGYLKAPWHLDFSYDYRHMERKASYYPHLRKQDITWHQLQLGIKRLFSIKRTDFSIRLASHFRKGKGGNPIDRRYKGSTGAVSSPDYMDDLLYKEKEYLTSKRIIPELTLRMERKYSHKTRAFIEINTSYTGAFDTKYLKGNLLSFAFSTGVCF